MTQDIQALIGGPCDDLDATIGIEDVREVPLTAVDHGGDGTGLLTVDIHDDLADCDS